MGKGIHDLGGQIAHGTVLPQVGRRAHVAGPSVIDGDAWLRTFVPRILGSPAFQSGGALFITFDEGSESAEASNHIATIVAGPTVPSGYRSATPHTHYSLLRTIQDSWGLVCLAESCAANTLGEFFP